MKLDQTFIIARPLDEVWRFFHDIPALARCLPGAEYVGPRDDGRHAGKVSSKVGPFQTSFEGDADISYDEAIHAITLEGKGVDRKGNSRGKLAMTCRLETAGAASTRVAVDSDVQLSGAIAQFGRTGIIAEIANVLIADFVRNVEATIPSAPASSPASVASTPQDEAGAEAAATAPRTAPAPLPVSKPVGGFRLVLLALKGWLRSRLGREA